MKFEEPLQWNVQIPRTKRQERSRFGSRSAYRAGKVMKDKTLSTKEKMERVVELQKRFNKIL